MTTLTPSTCITRVQPMTHAQITVCAKIEKRINQIEKDWLAKADLVPPSEQENYKAKVRYFVNELREQIAGAKNCVNRALELSNRIDQMISTYDTQLQAHYTRNEEFEKSKQKVQEGNASIRVIVRQMQPDLAPFQQKPGPNAKPVVNEPPQSQLTMQKGYEQITEIEQQWYKKAEHLPPDERESYCDAVSRYVGNLNKDVPLFKDVDPRILERSIQENAKIYDQSLEKNFQHNSREEWSKPEVDPLF